MIYEIFKEIVGVTWSAEDWTGAVLMSLWAVHLSACAVSIAAAFAYRYVHDGEVDPPFWYFVAYLKLLGWEYTTKGRWDIREDGRYYTVNEVNKLYTVESGKTLITDETSVLMIFILAPFPVWGALLVLDFYPAVALTVGLLFLSLRMARAGVRHGKRIAKLEGKA